MSLLDAGSDEFLSLCSKTVKLNKDRFRRDLQKLRPMGKRRRRRMERNSSKADTVGNLKIGCVSTRSSSDSDKSRKKRNLNDASQTDVVSQSNHNNKRQKRQKRKQMIISNGDDPRSLRRRFGIHVFPEDETIPKPCLDWTQISLSLNLDNSIWSRMEHNLLSHGMKTPLPIQMQCVPLLSNGCDVQSCAPTGSGKTLSFILPMLSRLSNHCSGMMIKSEITPPLLLGLVVAPTSVLCRQIQFDFRVVCDGTSFHSICVDSIIAPLLSSIQSALEFEHHSSLDESDLDGFVEDDDHNQTEEEDEKQSQQISDEEAMRKTSENLRKFNSDFSSHSVISDADGFIDAAVWNARLDDEEDENDHDNEEEQDLPHLYSMMDGDESDHQKNAPILQSDFAHLYGDQPIGEDVLKSAADLPMLHEITEDTLKKHQFWHGRMKETGELAALRKKREQNKRAEDEAKKNRIEVSSRLDDYCAQLLRKNPILLERLTTMLKKRPSLLFGSDCKGSSNPDSTRRISVLIGTPSLMTLLIKQGVIQAKMVQMLVLDEADVMFDESRLNEEQLSDSHFLLSFDRNFRAEQQRQQQQCDSLMGDSEGDMDAMAWADDDDDEDDNDEHSESDEQNNGVLSKMTEKQNKMQEKKSEMESNPHIQRVLQSATMDERTMSTIEMYFPIPPIQVSIGNGELAAMNIDQELRYCGDERGKIIEMLKFIEKGGFKLPILLFVQSPQRCRELRKELIKLFGERGKMDEFCKHMRVLDETMTDESEKMRLVKQFRRGEIWTLITTDVLCRGMDFPMVSTVISYDMPQCKQDYIHRIGRTGRADRRGLSVTFWSDIDRCLLLPCVVPVMVQSGSEDSIPKWLKDQYNDGTMNKHSGRVKMRKKDDREQQRMLQEYRKTQVQRGPIRRGGRYVYGKTPQRLAMEQSSDGRKSSSKNQRRNNKGKRTKNKYGKRKR